MQGAQDFGRVTPALERVVGMGEVGGDSGQARREEPLATFTHRQGQFLAFIHLYRKLHRRSPAELDIARYFGLTPPAVHGMIVKLDELGLIAREPGRARSIRVAIPPAEIPDLEDVEGPPS